MTWKLTRKLKLIWVRIEEKPIQGTNLIAGKKLEEYKCVENEVMVLVERTQEAMENAKTEMKEIDEKRKSGKKRRNDDRDTEEGGGRFQMSIKNKGAGGGGGKKKKLKK